jgi:hypothetical protein
MLVGSTGSTPVRDETIEDIMMRNQTLMLENEKLREEIESFQKASHADKNILITQLNKEINRVNTEILLVQQRLGKVVVAIQTLLNKP